jgi:hypothetical protein
MKHTILAIFAITTTAYCDITSDLIAHYLFNGNATDQTGGGYNGTVNGAQLTLDRFGTASAAYIFDGEDDFITVNKLLPDSAGFTISAWIRADTLKFAGIFYDSALNTGGRDTTFHTLSDGSLETQFSKISDPGPPYLNTRPVLTAGVWTHLVATTQPSGTAIYVNGSPVATDTSGSHNIGYHSMPYIGAENHGFAPDAFFHGGIDDVRVYTRALSAGDVSSLYQAEVVPEPSSALLLLSGAFLCLRRRTIRTHERSA